MGNIIMFIRNDDLTQVDDVSLMHVLHPLAYLPHVVDHLSLTHGVAFCGDPLEQLPARQAGKEALR